MKKNPDEIIEYAKAHLGEMGYNLFSNNCEHFASRCVLGVSKSAQSDNPAETLNKFLNSLFGGTR